MAVAIAGSNVRKRSGNENIGLAGLTLIVIGYAMTLSFLIVSTAFPFENLLALRNLTVIYMALGSVINVTGYVLLPWLINYSPKKLYGGKVMDAESGYVNVFLHILFSCATAYIWHWVWVYRVSSAIRGYKGGSELSPAVHLVLYILLPFYYIYWFYRHGHDILSKKRRTASAVKT